MSEDPVQKALQVAAEIEWATNDLIESGWGGYPWEHLGDASKDVRILIAGLYAATGKPAEAEDVTPDKEERSSSVPPRTSPPSQSRPCSER